MRRVNVNLFPHRGYQFKDTDGSTHQGRSWSDVIKRVTAYRARVGRSTDSVEQEVHEQACQNNPGLCYEDAGPRVVATEQAQKRITAKGTMLKWFARLIVRLRGNDIRYVGSAEASRRASICRGCPKNTEHPKGCSSCGSALTEYRKQLLGPHRQPKEELGLCSALMEDTATSVHLDEHRENNPALPGHCWRKSQ